MRILSISGQNIASLAAPFAIDFTAPPLAGAGLFAITGETGAGKSSILDAMCLALYGDAPRLAAGARGDRVPDAAGEEISAADSRAILRRGAATGWAEVRFAARDGTEYIARWVARRARDRAEGRLQNVARSLARASDGQVLAAQTQAVTEQVTALTGLSYAEFRRTVLLAQGDFDAFLRADTGERAELLEKVTGTGLYRAVSIRVYERTEAAKAAHAACVARAADHALLSDAARVALEAEAGQLQAGTAAAAQRRRALTEALAQHQRHQQAQAQLRAAAAAADLARAAQAAAGAERARLTQFDLAAPLRLPWQARLGAEKALQAAHEALAAAQAASLAATERAGVAAQTAARAQAALEAREQAFKDFAPIWDQAARLDAQILTARTEAEAAATKAGAARAAQAAAAKGLTDLQTARLSAEAARQQAAADLDRLRPVLPLAESWGQLRRDLSEHAAARAAQATALRAQATAQARGAEQAAEAAHLAAAEAADQATEAALAQQIAAIRAELAPLEAAHPPGRAGVLAALQGELATLDRACRDLAQAAAAGASAAAETAAARAQGAEATAEAARATEALTRAEAQVAALTAPLDAADLALSDAARSLRAALQQGAPCPVCGACDHPAPAEAGLVHLAEVLRRDQAAARAAAAAARAQLTAAQGALAGAAARAAQAAALRDQADASAGAATALWAEVAARAGAHPLCPALPRAPDAAGLAQAQTALAARQTAETQAQERIGALRNALSEKDKTREALRRALAARQVARADLAAAQAATAQELALAEARAQEAAAQLTRLGAALAPALAAAGESDPADPDLARRLALLVAEVGAAQGARTAAEAALAELAPRLARAAAEAETAALQADQARQDAAERAETLTRLQAERAPLLGGAPTPEHRSRFNAARLAAKAESEAATAALAEATATAAAAAARQHDSARTLSTTEAALEAARQTLAAALDASGLAPAALADLMAAPRDEIEALRARLRQLDDAVTAATAALAARQADLAALEATGLPAEPPETLAAALQDLDAQIAAQAHRLGELSAELARDAATRAKLADLARETEAARAEWEVWAAVNAAIGARSGDRFARIAQAITLDVLVDHANRHLTDLNPRYRLRRGAELALQVEDRDMGDTARATRSLSGGERFLVSLALALALSQMGGKGTFAGTLFIDEGFGALDAGSLDLAIDALETLQSQGRQVGVISHVEAMQARIATRIAVRKEGGGRSSLRVEGPGG